MNGIGHKETTLAALASLPQWQQDIWEPQREQLAQVYSLYGDTYAVKPEELGPYVELPDGSVPDFYMPRLRWKHHYAPATDYWEAPFYDRTLIIARHFADRIIQCLRADDLMDAAQFAGTFAHYVQDNACPGHAMDDTDLEIVKDLLPPPETLRRFPFHPRMEMSPQPFTLGDRKPIMLGRTVSELASMFVDRLVEMTLASRKTVLPFFQSFYEGDEKTAEELNLSNCKVAAALFADFVYTVTCIARQRVNGDCVSDRSLSEMYPYRQTAWAPGPYAQTAPHELVGVNLDDQYQPVPCELVVAGGSQTFEDALGAPAYYEYQFQIPSGIYHAFRCQIGIHATLGADRPIVFCVYSGDECLFEHEQKPGDIATSVELDWPEDGKLLRLVTTISADLDVQRVNDRPIVPIGHGVWACPQMIV